MPVFAADVLPDTTGRNLGNPSQLWNANLQSLNVVGSSSLQPVPGQNITPGGAIYVQTVPVSANTNTTNAQNLSGCTIPAFLLNAPGKVLRGTMAGFYTTQAAQTPSLIITVYLGSLQFFAIETAPLSASQPNNIWRIQWELTVYTPGSAGQIDPHGMMQYQATTGSYVGSLLLNTNAANNVMGPIDLTAAQLLQCQCLFTTNTSPANILTTREFIVEVIN